MSVLVPIKTKAPAAMMHPKAAVKFNKLREIVLSETGIDFLATCGDVFRAANFKSTKDGVADRSWHKTGRAFDYDQTCKALVVVSEPVSSKQYFRTFLKCQDQTGRQGVKRKLVDYQSREHNAYVFDFTAAAELQGFRRIPAWSGWRTYYNRREFWHYQLDDGLTWDAAMAQLRTAAAVAVTYGRNDRGDAVRRIQEALKKKGFLPEREIDGVFGGKTYAAVVAFQKSVNLKTDGLVGRDTQKALGV